MEIGKMPYLSAEDRARVSEAVQSAERRTRAEIVPMLVSRSGLYRDAQHRTGLILSLLVLTGLLTLEAAWLPWSWHAANAAWLILATLTSYALGAWLGSLNPVIRLVTSTERMRQKVRWRAELAFAQHGLSQTRERTGVLLMLSMLEHQVYVLPDREVARQVTSDQWNEVVQAVIERVKADDIAGGFCAGISRCETILARAYPVTSGYNPNEISDRMIEEP